MISNLHQHKYKKTNISNKSKSTKNNFKKVHQNIDNKVSYPVPAAKKIDYVKIANFLLSLVKIR